MQPGLYYNIPMADYLKIPALSKHALDILHECPNDYRLFREGKLEREQTRPMLLGSLGHGACLENRIDWVVTPETYEAVQNVCPKCGSISDSASCRKCKTDRVAELVTKPWNANADICDLWKSKQTLPIVSSQENTDLIGSRDSIRNDPIIAPVLAKGNAEVTIIAEYGGRLFKARADWLDLEQGGSLWDLKFTQDATTGAFSRELTKRRYYYQLALYWKLLAVLHYPIERCGFIAAEQFAPYRTNIRELKPSAMEIGQQELDADLELLERCERTNTWPGLSGSGPGVLDIDIPAWKYADGADVELTIGGQTLTM